MSKAPKTPPVTEARAKSQAKNLAKAIQKDTGEKVSLSKALDYLAQVYGYTNWRAMAAAYQSVKIEVHPDNFAMMESDTFCRLVQDIQNGIIVTAKSFFAEAQKHIDKFFATLPGDQSDYVDEIGQHLWPAQWAEKVYKTCGVETLEDALDNWTEEMSLEWQNENGRKHMLHPLACSFKGHRTDSDCSGYASHMGAGGFPVCLWGHYEHEAINNPDLGIACENLVQHLKSETLSGRIRSHEALAEVVGEFMDKMQALVPEMNTPWLEWTNKRLKEIYMHNISVERSGDPGFSCVEYVNTSVRWHINMMFLEEMDAASMEEAFEEYIS